MEIDDTNNALGPLLQSTVITHNLNHSISKCDIITLSEDFETQDLDFSFDDEPNYDRPQPAIVENFTLLPGEKLLMTTRNCVNLSLISTNHRIGTLYQTNYQLFFIDDTTHQMVLSIPNCFIIKIKKLKGHVTVKYHDNNNNNNNSNNTESNNSENNNNNNNNNNNSNNISTSLSQSTTTTTSNTHKRTNSNQDVINQNQQSDSIKSIISPQQPSPTNSSFDLPPQPNRSSRDLKSSSSTGNHKQLLKSVSTPVGLNESSNNINNSNNNSSTNNSNPNSICNSQSSSFYSNGISERALILEIRCKDFNLFRFCLPLNEKGNEAYDLISKLAFPESQDQLFAYSYTPYKGLQVVNGWALYDPIEEYTRQGLICTGSEWRPSKINQKYELCSTYPQYLMIPFSISDYLLNKSANFRNKSRIPVCTWRHRFTHATISRSSQPINGFGKGRCEEDELLVQAIRKCTPTSSSPNSTQPLFIYDIRSKSSIVNSSGSNHTEDISNYTHCQLETVYLQNIHELRESASKLYKVIRNWNEKKSWAEVSNTGWLSQISKLLSTSKSILNCVHTLGLSVLVHCIDGWDRCTQIISLVQLLADPYYRTLKGFIILICKEWLSFGHKFMTRNSSLASSPSKQTSPIFLQFIDCVWQLTKQFPTSFEFSDRFLSVILHHLNSNIFGTFLYDSEKERQANKVMNETESLWTLLMTASKNSSLLNPLFAPPPYEQVPPEGFVVRKNYDNANVLIPNSQGVQLWSEYYLKWRTPYKASRKSKTLITLSMGIPYINGDIIVVQKRRRSKRSSSQRTKSSRENSSSKDRVSREKSKSKTKEETDCNGSSTLPEKPSLTSSTSKRRSSSASSSSSKRKSSINPENESSILSTNPTSIVPPTTNPSQPILLATTNNHETISNPDELIAKDNEIEDDEIDIRNGEHNGASIINNEIVDEKIEINNKLYSPIIVVQEQSNYTIDSSNKNNNNNQIKLDLISNNSIVPIKEVDESSIEITPNNEFIQPPPPPIEITSISCSTSSSSNQLVNNSNNNNNNNNNNSNNNINENELALSTQQIDQQTIKDKELRRQEKEKRKKEKEIKLKERQERKEKSKEQKEKEKAELNQKPKADITVVLQSTSKAKAMSLTMPVRGAKSRISIFSSPNQSTQLSPTLHPNFINEDSNNTLNNSNSNSNLNNTSPMLSGNSNTTTPSPMTLSPSSSSSMTPTTTTTTTAANNNNNSTDSNSTISKRLFRTLRGNKNPQVIV